ncbi:hypothetical protein [Microbacterium sp. T2.11-28]|uniref:hypothetical protein n=1 Tax=Microbacterium sp. T2.11-28 TaxID=3041169 RepID=UPI0024777B21|nr:hypothetical protein [Microbacterium sp. T2.11-28]CAI9392047.1 hypothetical protein MICABA_01981 [Microbacterium sp. T2.11-28]
MTASKQLVNLLGVIVVLGILVSGLVLIALPMYTQAQTTNGSTRSVAASNDVYELQVTQLATAEARIGEIDGQLAALRTEISAETKYDDVFEIIAAAAGETEVAVGKITMTEPEAFTPRAEVVDVAGTGLPTEQDAAPTESDSSAEGESAGQESGVAEPTAPPADPTAPAQGQLQALITIEAQTDDADAAMAFVDLLRVGPRLILPINATLADGTLTLTAFTFIRTEDTP